MPQRNGLDPIGMGVAGQMICPLMSITHTVVCVKAACELWTELTYGAGTPTEKKVARCALYWNPVLLAEQTQEMRRLREALTATKAPDATP